MAVKEDQASERMLKKLAESGLDEADAKRLGFKSFTAAKAKVLGIDFMGFKIPYHSVDGGNTKFWRYRFTESTKRGAAALTDAKEQRYYQPPKTGCEAYYPRTVNWRDIAADVTQAIIITEGELKAACACKHGFNAIGLGGVWNFRNGKRGQLVLPSLRKFEWKDRRVLVIFDSDAAHNPQVMAAENALCGELCQLKAVPHVVRLPDIDGVKKTGLDDYIVANGPEALDALIGSAPVWEAYQELAKLNEEVVYVQDPGLIMRLDTRQKMSPSAFVEHAFSTRFMMVQSKDGDFKRVPTAKTWLAWEGRSEVLGLTYQPGQPRFTPDRAMNTWDGWGVEPKKGNVVPWKTLLDFLFKDAGPAARKYFEQWLAFQVQFPGVKCYTACVFWSLVHGVGKSLVGYTMARIFGKNFAEIEDKDLMGGDNSWAENKQFVMGDEITGGDKRHAADRMKSLITQKFIRIDIKYVPKFTQPDCINYLFTSNHPDAFFLEDTDRRFFVVEIIGQPMDLGWYKDVYDPWYKSDEGAGALFWHLLHLDLTGFDHRSPAPMTTAKAEMICDGRSDLSMWVHGLLSDPPARKLWTVEELLLRYDPTKSTKVTLNGMSRELKRCGVYRPFGTVQIRDYDGKLVRVWCFEEAVAKLPKKELIALRFSEAKVCKAKTKKFI